MQPPSQDPTNIPGQPLSSSPSGSSSLPLPGVVNSTGQQYDPLSVPPPPPGNYPPGEEEYYRMLHGDGGPVTRQRSNMGDKMGTLPQHPKRNGWKALSLVLFVLVLILATTTAVSFLIHPASPQNLGTTSQTPVSTPVATQAVAPTATTASGTSTPIPSLTSTPATAPTSQSAVPVASGTIPENILLTCGTNCDDPIHVTITSIHVDDGNGNMTWNISLKNVSGNSMGYGIDTFELLASGTQNQIHASFAQTSGALPNSDPVTIQGIFSFVPIQNTTYTLTVVIQENPFMGPQINFDPAQITNL